MKISFARTIRSTTHQFAQINSNQQEKDWGENLISAPVNSHPFRKGKARRARPSTRGAIWRRRETHPPSGSNRRAAWARTRRAPRRRRWGRRRRCGRRRGAPATPPPPPPTPTQDPRRRGGGEAPPHCLSSHRTLSRNAPPSPAASLPGSPAAGRRARPPRGRGRGRGRRRRRGGGGGRRRTRPLRLRRRRLAGGGGGGGGGGGVGHEASRSSARMDGIALGSPWRGVAWPRGGVLGFGPRRQGRFRNFAPPRGVVCLRGAVRVAELPENKTHRGPRAQH